jgi:hypothetical protein
MSYEISYPESKLDKVMTLEQFEQVVEAILAGKYSWACLLILRFGGYNPLHYIPYRTYNRLIKEHQQTPKPHGNRLNNINDREQLDRQNDRQLTKSELRQVYGKAIKDQLVGIASNGDSLKR